MAQLSSAITIARELATTDSNGLTDTLAIDFANFAKDRMMKSMIDKGVDIMPVQEATRAITDGQGTYLYPSDMFYVPKEIEVNWFENPATSKNYKTTDKLKESNIPDGRSVSWLRVNQRSNSPMIDYRGDYFEIFPTPQASWWGGVAGSSTGTLALRLFYYLAPTTTSGASNILYAATSDIMTNPEGLDYFSFGQLIKTVYFYSLGKINIDEMEKEFDAYVGKLIRMVQGDGMSPTTANGLNITGWEF